MGDAARAYAAGFTLEAFQVGMQQALVDAHRLGPAIGGAVAARVVSGLIRWPGRVTPPLRRWASRSTKQGARP